MFAGLLARQGQRLEAGRAEILVEHASARRHDSAAPPGAVSLGGPIVTAGGIVLIAGTFDPFIRAFDIETGKLLWQTKLPSSGHATPVTYQYKGKQYVVIAAGGHAHIPEEPQSDAIVAFTLP